MINGVVTGRGLPLVTGQTTVYVIGDNGTFPSGLPGAYNIYTTGQYSGTKNVDLIHRTATTISFDSASKEIRDSGNAMAMFKTGETIVVTGSASNNGVKTIATGNVAAKIVVNEALVDAAAGASVSIAKREAISNNCVLDLNTGLMWLRYCPITFGYYGSGNVPWRDVPYGAFQYCAAAIAVALGGYTDWQVPNIEELKSIFSYGTGTFKDTAAFPSSTTARYQSSTTDRLSVGYAIHQLFDGVTSTVEESLSKTEINHSALVLLVRG